MAKRNANTRQSPGTSSALKTRFLGHNDNTPTDTLEALPLTRVGACADLITLQCSEFTSLCPVTGAADFGTLEITYSPCAHVVETKSLKLYLSSYRTVRAFNEVLVERIAADFYAQIRPQYVKVRGTFHPRGGISVIAEQTLPLIPAEHPYK